MKLKPLGIVRKIDELGRVVIPKEIRRQQGWKPGTPVEMLGSDDGSLVVRAYTVDENDKTILALEAKKEFVDDMKSKRILDNAIKLLQK